MPTGRLWRADGWLRTRLSAGVPDLPPVGERLAGYGITAVTDATPDLDPATYGSFAAMPQRVTLLGVPLGRQVSPPLVTGPYKIVLADSGLPSLPDLVDQVRAARAAGRAVAVHCVTREALLLLLAALASPPPAPGRPDRARGDGPGRTIAELARRGLTIVTLPGFLADRGDDYLRDVPEPDDLYRVRRLMDADVNVRLSSDAPYGPLDPWRVIEAAVQRRTPQGAVARAGERVTRRQALRAYLGPPIRPGRPADLVLLDAPGAVDSVCIGGECAARTVPG